MMRIWLGNRFAPTLFYVGVILIGSACQQEDQPTYSSLGPIPPSPQRAGDPARGREALLNEPYITCGMPETAYRKIAPEPPPETLLAERRGRNAELPYYLTHYRTPDGVDLVVSNCLNCHAAFIADRFIIGLGNEQRDFTGDSRVSVESVGLYLSDPEEIEHWRRWADIITAVAPYMMTDTVGVNPAINLTLALMAHRDPVTLDWSAEPLMEPPPENPLPVSVPPWWRLAKKNALYNTSEGRGDHARAMMLGAILCANDVETLEKIDRYAPDIRAFFASIEPPSFPWSIDNELALEGQTVFETHCSACHGTYGENDRYPNLVVGLDVVGTDPLQARSATDGSSDRFIKWFNRSFFGRLSRAAPAPGYVPPPLDGIWATAPFLHNGSIPTLAALLDSRIRPTYWVRSFDRDDYDPSTVGWRYRELSYGKPAARDETERKRLYDTTLPGYSNAGHTFGDDLTDRQRKALLEYLKTL
ncbi:c-type cytochrome [Methylohalobius crimeensis]|uniref:c-type cytochrome n=1 Tax=Methylohalobius crimeensis TaxID=244365 RepID=UPI0003B67BCE|nr:c-type cytochrome [Methylohalobius crimeensis]